MLSIHPSTKIDFLMKVGSLSWLLNIISVAPHLFENQNPEKRINSPKAEEITELPTGAEEASPTKPYGVTANWLNSKSRQWNSSHVVWGNSSFLAAIWKSSEGSQCSQNAPCMDVPAFVSHPSDSSPTAFSEIFLTASHWSSLRFFLRTVVLSSCEQRQTKPCFTNKEIQTGFVC